MIFYQYTRSLCRKMVQIRRNFVTTCTVRSTRGAKLPVDATFSGRSMVEMLGVLAIIGVLSVGAIAGYQKAIKKYKLNKFATSYSVLLSNAIQLSSNVPDNKSSSYQGQITLLKKLNFIPEGMSVIEQKPSYINTGENVQIRDVFNNEILFFTRSGFGYTWGILARIQNTNYGFDICYITMTIAKEYSPYLNWVLREDFAANGGWSGTYFYGDEQ